MIKVSILLFFSIIIFLLGYNAIFNTVPTMSKFVSLAGYKEGSRFYKILLSENNMHWVKVSGIALIIFALALFAAVIVVLINIF